MACAACCAWSAGENETVIDGVASKEALATPPATIPDNAFVVELQKGMAGMAKGGNQQLGIVLDLADEDLCIVKEIEGGLAAAWNQTCHESQQIKPCDRIVRVNGVAGSSRDLAAILLAKHDVLSIALVRPEERVVDLAKSTDLGILVKYKRGSLGFWIDNITDGEVQKWNLQNPDSAVHPHDRVVAVNGDGGSGAELLASMKNKEVLQFKVMHYARS
mmetsp:Transcript_784/g.1500  ORF Transcript_784/g.1500 Transcript_784/m.1500 type:complete len:218 (+) Transcript_784:72-725(+)